MISIHKMMFTSAILALFSCGDGGTEPKVSEGPKRIDCGAPSSCVPANSALIEMTCPTGSETITAGDTVVLRWRSIVSDFTGYRPQASTDGGTNFNEIFTESILPSGSEDAQCLSYTFVIPSDGSYTGEVIFRVRDYNSSSAEMRDAAEAVTVLAP